MIRVGFRRKNLYECLKRQTITNVPLATVLGRGNSDSAIAASAGRGFSLTGDTIFQSIAGKRPATWNSPPKTCYM